MTSLIKYMAKQLKTTHSLCQSNKLLELLVHWGETGASSRKLRPNNNNTKRKKKRQKGLQSRLSKVEQSPAKPSTRLATLSTG